MSKKSQLADRFCVENDDIKLKRPTMDAREWLMHYIRAEHIPEDQTARSTCRYTDDVEMLCGMIANQIGSTSSQIYIAGILYNNPDKKLDEISKLKEIRSAVIKTGNIIAQEYVTLHRYKRRLFEGKTRQFRIERNFRDRISTFAEITAIFAADIYLLRWWMWFFDFITVEPILDTIKDNRRAKAGIRITKDVIDDLKEEIEFWSKYLE